MIEVRFKGYRYNTGCGDNGIYDCKIKLEDGDISGASKFVKYIHELIDNHHNMIDYSEEDYDFLDGHDINFITEYIGTFEVYTMERRLYIERFIE